MAARQGITLGVMFVLGAAAGVGKARWDERAAAGASATADLRPVLERLKEVARLETLDINVYKKVHFEPDVSVDASALEDLAHWAAHAVRPKSGKAVVFATAHLGVDLARLEARKEGGQVVITLPPVETRVELKPLETEVYDSNLEPAQLQEMLWRAQQDLRTQLSADLALQRRAQKHAQDWLRSFLLGAGVPSVVFTATRPAPAAPASGTT